MKVRLFTCADSLAIDLSTNRVSLFNILEDFNAVSFPFVVPSFVVFTLVTREPDEAQKANYRLRIVREGERRPILDTPIEINFQTGLIARHYATLQGMPIPSPGLLKVQLRSVNRTIESWNIRVNLVGHPQITLQQEPTKAVPVKKRAKTKKTKKRRKKSAKKK